MKRKIVVAICILLMLSLSVVTVFAAGSVNMSLKSSGTSVTRGEEITITVAATVDTCGSGGVEVFYDTSVFEMVSGSWLIEAFMKDFSTETNDGAFALEGNAALSGNVFQFVLKAKEGAVLGSSSISVMFKADTVVKTDSMTVTIECKHEYDSGEVTKEATCTSDGTRVRTCKICNATKNETIEKLGHAYDDGEIVTPAGCIEVGEMLYHCTRCDKTKNEEIPPAGHSYENDCDADCDICGNERTVEHNYDTHWTSDATGHWHQCLDCGDVLEIFRHTPGPEATETTEQICLDCGYVIQTFKPHEHVSTGDWLGDANSHWYQCQCGENFNMEAHVWDAGTPEEATGTITYHCTTCGYAKTVKQEAPQPTESEPGNQTSTEPKDDPKDDDNNESVWMIVSLVLAILLLAAIAFIVVGFITSKKQTGKFSH